MDVNELLATAWAAVEGAGVPKELHETAFKEAVAYLRESDAGPAGSGSGKGTGSGQKGRATRKTSNGRKSPSKSTGTVAGSGSVDPAEFFSRLAEESGVEEKLLRDTFQLGDGGKVHVIQRTSDLGDNVAEQARIVIPLVAAARAIGLGEDPVKADAVRDELKRKRCWDSGNFAGKHLGKLVGFKAGGSRADIVLTSTWDKEFVDAMTGAHGGTGGDED